MTYREAVSTLRRLGADHAPQVAVLSGWPGIGKTTVVRRAFFRESLSRRHEGQRPELDGDRFYFCASRVTFRQNWGSLVRALGRGALGGGALGSGASGGESIASETWTDLMREIGARDPAGASGNVGSESRPSVVVLDEVQRLFETRSDESTFVEALCGMHEDVASSPTASSPTAPSPAASSLPAAPSLWVLCGSHVLVLERLADLLEAELGAERVHRISLEPLDYRQSSALLSFGDPRKQFLAYALWGGIPGHLTGVDEDSMEESVVHQLIGPGGAGRRWADQLLAECMGVRHVDRYAGIVRAVGSGRRRQREIASRIGSSGSGGGAMRAKLRRLVRTGLLRASRRYLAGERSPYRYEITDPALRFRYGLVAPLESRIELAGPRRTWRRLVASSDWKRYLARHFHLVTREALTGHAAELDLPPVERCYRWDGRVATGTRRTLDLLAPLEDGRIMTGTIVGGGEEAGVEILHDHLRTLRIIAWSGPASGVGRGEPWAERATSRGAPVLFASRGGFTSEFRAAAARVEYDVQLLDLEDLYR